MNAERPIRKRPISVFESSLKKKGKEITAFKKSKNNWKAREIISSKKTSQSELIKRFHDQIMIRTYRLKKSERKIILNILVNHIN